MPSETFNIPPTSTVTLPLGLPDTALWMGVDTFMHSFIFCVSLNVTFFPPYNYRIQQNVFINLQASYNTSRQNNEVIVGGLEAALGMMTHPIYSIVKQTCTYYQ